MKKRYITYGVRLLSLLAAALLVLAGCADNTPTQQTTDPTTGDTTVTTGGTTTTTAASSDGTTDDTTLSEDTTTAVGETEDTTRETGTTTEFVGAKVPTVTTTTVSKATTTTVAADEAFTKPNSGAFTSKSKALKGKNGKLTGFKLLTAKLAAYNKVEFEMDLPKLPADANVYKEEDVDITAVFTSSTGKKLTVDAFYYEGQEFDAKTGYLRGPKEGVDPTFRLRVSPQGGGTWDFKVTLAVKGDVVDTLTGYINVAKDPNGSKILEVEPVRKQVFQTRSGKLTPLLGENICWPADNTIHIDFGIYVPTQMEYISEYGANYIRVWDYLDSGGSVKEKIFQMKQGGSAMFDKMFEKADETGVYIDFVLLQHGEISTMVDARWDASIWHTNQGGYLTDPVEFFTDEKTFEAFKCYCRYIVSRWGYSEYLMAWELFNEIDHTNAVRLQKYNEVRAWFQKAAGYLREVDTYKHMVSNSCGYPNNPLAIYSEFDFIFFHRYDYESMIEPLATLQKNTWNQHRVPVVLGETGIDGWRKAGLVSENVTPDLTMLHQTVWACIMGGGASSGLTWHWDQVDKHGGQWMYKVPAEMAAQIPYNDPNMFMANTTSLSPSNDQIGGMGYRGKNYAYLWFYDTKYTQLNLRETTFKGEDFTVRLNDGKYYVCWVDTWTGVSLKKETVTAKNGELKLDMPTWSKDVAVTVREINK